MDTALIVKRLVRPVPEGDETGIGVSLGAWHLEFTAALAFLALFRDLIRVRAATAILAAIMKAAGTAACPAGFMIIKIVLVVEFRPVIAHRAIVLSSLLDLEEGTTFFPSLRMFPSPLKSKNGIFETKEAEASLAAKEPPTPAPYRHHGLLDVVFGIGRSRCWLSSSRPMVIPTSALTGG